MSKFRKYLKDTGQTMASFAAKIGKAPNYLSEIASYKRMPSLRTAYAIHIATKKKVPIEYWLFPEPKATSGPAGVSQTATTPSTYGEPQHAEGQ